MKKLHPWGWKYCLRNDMECDPRHKEKHDIQHLVESNTGIMYGVKLLAGYAKPPSVHFVDPVMSRNQPKPPP